MRGGLAAGIFHSGIKIIDRMKSNYGDAFLDLFSAIKNLAHLLKAKLQAGLESFFSRRYATQVQIGVAPIRTYLGRLGAITKMPFRALYNDLLEYEGSTAFTDVLTPWLDEHQAEVEWLRSVRDRTEAPVPSVSEEELWQLYAASRAFELLALRFQKGLTDGSEWPGPPISEEEFAEFSRRLGLDVLRPTDYSPFHHEVVELTRTADADQPALLSKYHWPCLMLGSLLFMRAGVTISAGSRVMAPEVATKSTLYWAYRRKNRPYQDLSHGWGSNSQWRTSFRRDYYLNETLHFNVDGKVDLSTLRTSSRNEEGLSPQERMELVVNRCFVTTTKDSDDQFPYEDRFSMKAK